MVRPDRDRLAGRVEVDETYVGSEEAGVDGRGALKKALIVVAAEQEGRHGIGLSLLRIWYLLSGLMLSVSADRLFPMPVLRSLLRILRLSIRTRAALQLEMLALRHQLHVLERSRPRRLPLTWPDRLLWVGLSRI